jgi:hypothetical protein
VAGSLFLNHYTAVEVDMSNPFANWMDSVQPFNGVKHLISKVVVIVEGFRTRSLFAITELARLFGESSLMKRVDKNELHVVPRGFRFKPQPLEHVLIHATLAIPERPKITKQKSFVHGFCKMVAELGRMMRGKPGSNSRGERRRKICEMAMEKLQERTRATGSFCNVVSEEMYGRRLTTRTGRLRSRGDCFRS